jgi:hypothetical protein
MWLVLVLILALPSLALASSEDLLMTSSQDASPDQVNSARDYGLGIGKSWIKSEYNIDVDAITRNNGMDLGKSLIKSEFNIDLDALSDWQIWRESLMPASMQGNQGLGGDSGAPCLENCEPAAKNLIYNIDLRVEEDDDLRVLQSDISDIPFGVRLNADAGLLSQSVLVKTSFFMPLSWKDELRAETDMSFPSLALPWMGTLMNLGGFASDWAWKSSYANRLGVSSVETGLGTQWLRIWELNYEMKMQFGQDNYEESQWLKLGTRF